jgi:multimeric flavodoxin WrbA
VNAIILDGSHRNDDSLDTIHGIVVEELTRLGCTAESIILHEMNIAHCIGCLECWVATPGLCRMADDGRLVAERLIQSDVIVMLTPVTFGGYSAELKKALDRAICLVLPYFVEEDGEIHHEPRYQSFPRMMIVGVIPEHDEEAESVFRQLIARNARNFHPLAHGGAVIATSSGDESIRTEIRSLLASVGAAV